MRFGAIFWHHFKHTATKWAQVSTNSQMQWGISLLKDKLRGVIELKAAFAPGSAGNSTDLDALLQAIESLHAEYLDEIERRNARKAGKAAAAAQAAGSAKGSSKGKKGKQMGNSLKVTCTHCGKPNHEAKQCRLNLSTISYRPELASKAAAKAALNPPPGTSASRSGNTDRAAAGVSVNEVLTKVFAEFLSRRRLQVLLWMFPSQCVEDQHWDTLEVVEGVTGQASSTSSVAVEVLHLGCCHAIVMVGSMNMVCICEVCEDLGWGAISFGLLGREITHSRLLERWCS